MSTERNPSQAYWAAWYRAHREAPVVSDGWLEPFSDLIAACSTHNGFAASRTRDSSASRPPHMRGCSTAAYCSVWGPSAGCSVETCRGRVSVNTPQGDCRRRMDAVSSSGDMAQTFSVYWTRYVFFGFSRIWVEVRSSQRTSSPVRLC